MFRKSTHTRRKRVTINVRPQKAMHMTHRCDVDDSVLLLAYFVLVVAYALGGDIQRWRPRRHDGGSGCCRRARCCIRGVHHRLVVRATVRARGSISSHISVFMIYRFAIVAFLVGLVVQRWCVGCPVVLRCRTVCGMSAFLGARVLCVAGCTLCVTNRGWRR